MDRDFREDVLKNVKKNLVLFKERDKIIYRTIEVDKFTLKCKVEDKV